MRWSFKAVWWKLASFRSVALAAVSFRFTEESSSFNLIFITETERTKGVMGSFQLLYFCDIKTVTLYLFCKQFLFWELLWFQVEELAGCHSRQMVVVYYRAVTSIFLISAYLRHHTWHLKCQIFFLIHPSIWMRSLCHRPRKFEDVQCGRSIFQSHMTPASAYHWQKANCQPGLWSSPCSTGELWTSPCFYSQKQIQDSGKFLQLEIVVK